MQTTTTKTGKRKTPEQIEREVSTWTNDTLIQNGNDAAICFRNGEMADIDQFGVGILISELTARLSAARAALTPAAPAESELRSCK